MKTEVLRWFRLLLLLGMPTALQAQFTFTTNNGAITITGFTGGGAVVIPSTTNGYPVTSIADQAFYGNKSITSVTIPNSVTNIGTWVFVYCTSIKEFTVEGSNPNYSSLAGVLFDKQQAALLCYPVGSTNNNYAVPDSVTSIADETFHLATSLTNITFGNNLTSIGGGVCAECAGLTSVTFPNSVTNIGGGVFWGCYYLRSVTLGNSVTSIGNSAFAWCSNLTSIVIPDSVTSMGEEGVFNDCTSLTNATIGSGLTNIVGFWGCSSLTSITIPNTVTSIGTKAFKGCTSLTDVSIPNSVTNIGSYAFAWCASLPIITIPRNVTSLGDYAFAHCTNLKIVLFLGNAPAYVFLTQFDTNATLYCLRGSSGWHWGFIDPVWWFTPQAQTGDGSFGVRTNQFGFNITGSSNLVLVVEACTNLSSPAWQPVQTNKLIGGQSYFGDPQWTNNSGRFYRLRWP